MTSPRIVSVFGATGLQGGSVIKGLLEDGTFVPRAITRNPDSEAAKKLKARGVEVVQGDSLIKEGLADALRGSEAVFAVSVSGFNPNKETGDFAQGKNIVDAAKEAGVKFFIWSSLPSISKISGGKYKNVVGYDATDDGYVMAYPILKPTDLESYAWIARDVPAAVLVILKHYTDSTKEINGKIYPIVNATIPGTKLAELATKALGAKVTFTTAPPMGAVGMDEMFMAHVEYKGLYTGTPVPNPDLVTLGMKFSTVEEFMEVELKPRFMQ
ncbi:NmrA domain-containing protein [Favolaschia claudopus]|uniref:NmrA domain-containing protein n=1 Tax=Favolaschia claudopus TaxID=2862362 RepID=A0AAW0D8H7_9AGAR